MVGTRTWSRLIGTTLAVALALLGTAFIPLPAAVADTQPADTTLPPTVSADPLPTVQINGVVRKQLIVGNTVYVGGEFTRARPAGAAAGTSETVRNNMLAYNLSTGELITAFNPDINAQVKDLSVSPDKTKLYAAGSFTTAGGQTKYRVVQFQLSNNGATATMTSWRPAVNGPVNGVYATDSAVFLGGTFTTVNNVDRPRLASVSATNGNTVLPMNAVVPDYAVQDITGSPDGSQILIVGNFTQVNGSTRPGTGMARLNAQTGALLPLPLNSEAFAAGESAGFLSTETDGTYFYGTGWHYGPGGNIEGVFSGDWATGSIHWIEDCHGDTYSAYPVGNVIYAASHKHYCGNSGGFPQTDPWTIYHSTAMTRDVRGQNTADIYGYPDHPGTPRPEILDWYPQWTVGTYTGINQAVWNVTGNSDYVLYGGEFPRVNTTNQQGLVRFARREIAPNKVPPTLNTAKWPLSAVSIAGGSVRLSWAGNPDKDNATITYRIYRGSMTNPPIYQVTVKGYHFWQLPRNTFLDTGLAPGSAQRYRVEAVDPYGNWARSDWTDVTVSSGPPLSPYAQRILNDGATSYWRLGQTGTTAIDYAGGNDLTNRTGVTGGASGAINGDSDPASTYSGDDNGRSYGTAPAAGPQQFAAEAWFNTTTTRGGKILGYGNAANGATSNSYDRHVYMRNDGRLVFGVYPNAVRTVTSSAAYNNGQWHHVVAQLSAAGMELYVDGVRVASRTDTTSAQAYNGVWRIGGDNINGWDGAPSSANFAGRIDEVSVYDRPMTSTVIKQHYTASGRTLPNNAPTAAFDTTVRALNASFDASPSTDPEGGPLTFRWDFGDGSSPGTDAAPDHTYSGAGSYTVTLTVTDDEGAVATATRTVTTTQPNPQPADAYGAAVYAADPRFYWRLDESSGSVAGDSSVAGADPGAIRSGVTLGQPGALLHQSRTAAAFNGSNGLVVDTRSATNPGAFTTMLWFKTSTTSGGKLVGFGDASDGDSGSYDRHTYMLDSGQLRFGVWTGQENTITSPASYNDGRWHMLAASQSPTDGMRLYVDGQLVGTNSQTAAQSYTGYWRIGGDTTWGGSTSRYFNGSIDEAAVFTRALDAATVGQLYAYGTQNADPTARFTSTTDGLAVDVDGSSSSDSDGSVATYAWDFGDGATQSGTDATVRHTYGSAGTYTVRLTVTDSDGATDTVTHDVTVRLNQPPVPAFTATASKLTVATDATASTDDSAIASYAWDFGESAGAGDTRTGPTATYTYATTGTYTVTLVVTDDDGATNTLTRQVEVTGNQAPTAVIADPVVAGQRVSVDGSGSSDADGSVASYAWDFGATDGPGDTATGATASYTYADPGTYTVTLTVTDDDGVASTATRTVTVESGALAGDAFGRTVAGGWGSADVGGPWTSIGTASRFSVAGGRALHSLPASATDESRLGQVAARNVDATVSAGVNALPSTGYVFAMLGSRISGPSSYWARLRINSDGTVGVHLLRDGTALTGTNAVAGLSITAADRVWVRFQTESTSDTATTLRVKVWKAGTTEPTAWTYTRSETTPENQVAGAVGVKSFAGNVGNNPLTVSYDDLTVARLP